MSQPFLLALSLMIFSACGGSQSAADTPRRDVSDTDTNSDGDSDSDSDSDSDGNGEAESSDGLQVGGLLGSLEESQIESVIRRKFRAFERCYGQGVGANWFVGGKVELKFRVKRDGLVKKVGVSGGTLGSWTIESCILKAAKQLKFPSPKGGEAAFAFPIQFPSRAEVKDMTGKKAQHELSRAWASLKSCTATGPMPERVQVTVYVSVGGEVKAAGFASGDVAVPVDEDWASCAHEKALSWTLSDPRGSVRRIQGWYE